METITHLSNVSTFFEKMHNPEVAKLRMHYSRCCKEISDRNKLPTEKFGAAALCPQCASPWSLTKHKTRVASGKKLSRRMISLVRGTSNRLRLSMFLRTLIQKYKRNRANKIIKMCSVCSGTAKLALSKPQRRKLPKSNNLSKDSNLIVSSKKKKKRVKDKTAGLNVSGIKMSDTHSCPTTPILGKKRIHTYNVDTPMPVSKPKKIDLSKMMGIIDTSVTLSKKNKLHTFLQELC